jgi:ATP-dependent exoDNAse (exonuclease V) alpha subunit
VAAEIIIELTFITKILESFPFDPTQGQKLLAELLGNFIEDKNPQSVFVLKGYAGTGKTSFVSAMVKVLPMIRKKAVLLAPTGRAAKVISAYAGQPAWTIHKRIYFQRVGKDGSVALVLQKNLYRNAIFIVDEASMIAGSSQDKDHVFSSRNLLDDLVDYVASGESCKLLLIGDTAQLPPVGMPVSPALDLEFLKSRYNLKIFSCELTEVMRQSLESGILFNATHLRELIASGNVSYPLFNLDNRKDIVKISGQDLEDLLHTSFSSAEPAETVVICRSNKRANMFNREIRNRILFLENEISSGDFLMVVRNNYFWLDPQSGPGFIANGDIIEVLQIRNIEELYGLRFADVTIRLADYPDEPTFDVKILLDVLMADTAALPEESQKKLFTSVLEEYNDIPQRTLRFEKVRTNPYYNALQVKFAYALTCHKTQGGQWQHVFVDQGYLKDEMIDYEYLRWLYTALTRATKKLYLLGFQDKFFSN